jgi:hypothetical protein
MPEIFIFLSVATIQTKANLILRPGWILIDNSYMQVIVTIPSRSRRA